MRIAIRTKSRISRQEAIPNRAFSVRWARYLDWLREAADQFGCRIHADVLMTNQVHLLPTPIGELSDGVVRW